MILNLIFVVLISSVVIASENSCENDGNVSVQDIKYFQLNGGFFYIHGLTNGESVVMYQTPDDENVFVQYTIINDDCLYETQSYNIMQNGTYVDHVIVMKKQEEFSISESLSFDVDGKPVELKFKINQSGYVLEKGNELKSNETLNPEKSTEVIKECVGSKDIDLKDVAELKYYKKEKFDLKFMKNGRFFYQNFNDYYVYGKYVFKTSNGDYYTVNYQILSVDPTAIVSFKSSEYSETPETPEVFEIIIESYNVKDADNYSEKLSILLQEKEDITNVITLCIKSTGVSIAIPEPTLGLNEKPVDSGQIAPSRVNSMKF